MRHIAFLAAGLTFALSQNAQAIPIVLDLTSGADDSFEFPLVNNANQSPLTLLTDTGLVTFYREGVGPAVSVIDPVLAEVSETSVVFLSGTLRLSDGTTLPDFVITGGTVSFVGVGPDEFAGTLETSAYGTFHILDRNWVPTANLFPPNSFDPGEEGTGDGGYLALWANNWNVGDGPVEGAPWGIDFVFLFERVEDPGPGPGPVIPEPGAALLLGLGVVIVGIGRRHNPRAANPPESANFSQKEAKLRSARR